MTTHRIPAGTTAAGETLLVLSGIGIALVFYVLAKLLTFMAKRHLDEVSTWHQAEIEDVDE